jgi:ABC-2 type transport system ATP-binding protein
VIADGRIVAQGTPRELKAGVADGSVVEVELFGVEEESVERVRGLEGVRAATIEDRDQKQLLIVQTAPGVELTHAILSQLNGASIGRVSSREPTLEDAYVQLVTSA